MSSEPRLYLRQLEVGPMQNFVYLIGDREKRECVVVDAAWDIDAIVDCAQRDDMKIVAGLVTHFHPDHLGGAMMGMEIQGAAELIAKLPVKIHLHKSEAPFANRIAGLSSSDMVLTEAGDVTRAGDLEIKFLHTPGHTPGSQCFLVDGNLVSGDTLFIGSCGRVDLPGSSPEDLFHSLNDTLKVLPPETVLFPGHNYSDRTTSTIGDERRRNPYMRFERLQDFLSVMGY
ncbi:MBL fold metallo-hydrolase [Candidatus Binatia bacterium]|jgi:glyoxylase-like metal-dependent hydrolase (beta-lactamase superfamily II)|nr:MBL fold metallo-hydrolase [Candidatus Binatia bacterium]